MKHRQNEQQKIQPGKRYVANPSQVRLLAPFHTEHHAPIQDAWFPPVTTEMRIEDFEPIETDDTP